jgi:hypothetical protein
MLDGTNRQHSPPFTWPGIWERILTGRRCQQPAANSILRISFGSTRLDCPVPTSYPTVIIDENAVHILSAISKGKRLGAQAVPCAAIGSIQSTKELTSLDDKTDWQTNTSAPVARVGRIKPRKGTLEKASWTFIIEAKLGSWRGIHS